MERGFGEHPMEAGSGCLWLARIAAGVARPQPPVGTNPQRAMPPISYTRSDQARHVLYQSRGL